MSSPSPVTTPRPGVRCGDTRTGALRLGGTYFNARHDCIEVLDRDGTWRRVSTPRQVRAAAVDGVTTVRVTPPGSPTSLELAVPVSATHGKSGNLQVLSDDPAPLVLALWHGLGTGKGDDTVTIPAVHGVSVTLSHARGASAREHVVSVTLDQGVTVTVADRDPGLVEQLVRFLAQPPLDDRFEHFARHPAGQQFIAQLPDAPEDVLCTVAANPTTFTLLAQRATLSDQVILVALNSGADPALFMALASPALRRQLLDRHEADLAAGVPEAVALATLAFLHADTLYESSSVFARLNPAQRRQLALDHPGALTTAQIDRFYLSLGPEVALALDNVDPGVVADCIANSTNPQELAALLANTSLDALTRTEALQRLYDVTDADEARRLDREAWARRLRDPEVSELLSDITGDAVRRVAVADAAKAVLWAHRDALAALTDAEILSLAAASGLPGDLIQALPVERRVLLVDPDGVEDWADALGPEGVAAAVSAVFAVDTITGTVAARVLAAALDVPAGFEPANREALAAAMQSAHGEVHELVAATAAAWRSHPDPARRDDGDELLLAIARNQNLHPDLLASIAAAPGFTGHSTLVAADPARVAASLAYRPAGADPASAPTYRVWSPSHLAAVLPTAVFASDTLEAEALAAVRDAVRTQGAQLAASRPDPHLLVTLCWAHAASRDEFAAVEPRYDATRASLHLTQIAMREAIRSGEPDLAWQYVDALRSDPVLATLDGLSSVIEQAYLTEMKAVTVHAKAHALAAESHRLHTEIEHLNSLIAASRWRQVPLLPHRQKVRRRLAEQLSRQIDQVTRLVSEHPTIFGDPRLYPPSAPLSPSELGELKRVSSRVELWKRTARRALGRR